MKYGYARVSTDGQSVDAQVRQLTKAGCKKVFREVASGAKTTRDLLNILAAIRDLKAGFRSRGDAWADTTTPHGRVMLTVLGGLAEFERVLIRAPTSEGRARAMALGNSLGRPFKMTARQRKEALARRESGELPCKIARSYNVSGTTISRLAA